MGFFKYHFATEHLRTPLYRATHKAFYTHKKTVVKCIVASHIVFPSADSMRITRIDRVTDDRALPLNHVMNPSINLLSSRALN